MNDWKGTVSVLVIGVEALSSHPLAGSSGLWWGAERRSSVVEDLAAVVSANLQRAVRLRQSILQIAFTGRL